MTLQRENVVRGDEGGEVTLQRENVVRGDGENEVRVFVILSLTNKRNHLW